MPVLSAGSFFEPARVEIQAETRGWPFFGLRYTVRPLGRRVMVTPIGSSTPGASIVAGTAGAAGAGLLLASARGESRRTRHGTRTRVFNGPPGSGELRETRERGRTCRILSRPTAERRA